MAKPPIIRVELSDGIATVIVDRPEKLNALNSQAIRELGEVFDELRADDEVRGVIVTGAGDKAFVAGADVAELTELSPIVARKMSRNGQGVFSGIEGCPKPVVAAIGGHALGGGCELALACHLRVASEDAKLGLPEVRLGLIPGYGGTVRLARLIGLGRAVEMILTGETVDARKAFEIGLVHAVVPRGELLAKARERIEVILANGPLAVRMALEATYGAQRLSTDEALRLESFVFGLLASTEDMKEGTRAFIERRKAEFKGK
ncbi:MAG: enoyl-CoA hydratase [Gemmatimonadetes bacterium]|nr:enoyl-CoA hydratase [Gemmatimonadota bacterium]